MDDLGQPSSIIYVVSLLFVVALFLFLGFIAFSSINEKLLENEVVSEYPDAVGVIQKVDDYGGLLDYIYLFFMIAFLLAMPIAAYFAPSHPALFVGFIFLFFISLTLSVVFSDTFTLIGEDGAVEEQYNEMPIIKNFMYYLPLITIINGVIVGVILFGKARAGAGEY